MTSRWKILKITSGQLLLDTHTLLWYAQGDARLPATTALAIRSAGADCLISRVTLWKVAIKSSLAKLVLPGGFAGWQAAVQIQGFVVLEISDAHLLALHQLPYVGDHRDPFDRLFIAQALCEGLTPVSRDGKFADYPGLQLRWA